MTNQLKTSHSDMDITDITNLTNRINNLHRNRSFNILRQPYISGVYFSMNIPPPAPIIPIKQNDITENELNYSIYAEDKIRLSSSPDTQIRKIIPKINDKWVESKMIYNCQKCNTGFGFLVRKHHCRSCGGVYCYKCCDKYIEIPKDLIKIPQQEQTYKSSISNYIKCM